MYKYSCILTVTGSTASIVSLCYSFKDYLTTSLWITIIADVIILIYLILIGIAIRQSITIYNNSKYRRAIKDLSGIFTLISERRQKPWIKRDTICMLKGICNIISNCFREIKGKPCGVCIKIFEDIVDKDGKDDEVAFSVKTIARDVNSTVNRTFVKNDGDLITENSDFLDIFLDFKLQDGGTFISNNLLKEKNYLNSSSKFYRNNAKYEEYKKSNWKKFFSGRYWPLPYKSTTVSKINGQKTA